MDNEIYELVIESQNGDKESFSKLILNFEKDLYKIASIRLTNNDDVDDAIQTTIESVFKNIKKLKEPKYFKTWLIKILINNCNFLYNKRKNKTEFNENIEENGKDNSEEINSKLDFQILIRNLNEKEKMTMMLYYSQNITTKEISKILKEPESTIRNRISRAVNKLKKEYGGRLVQ